MNVSLTPELEKMVNDEVKGGEYSTASEVVREALRLFKRERKFIYLRNEILKGGEQIKNGQYQDVAEEELPVFFEEIHKRGVARLQTKKKSAKA